MCLKRKQNSSSDKARNRLQFLKPREPRQAEFSYDYSKKPLKYLREMQPPSPIIQEPLGVSKIGDGLSHSGSLC